MLDSSVKSLGEVEYDNQNCLKNKEKPVRRKIRREVNVLVLLYISRSITKKFSIETLLKMMDSSVKSHGEAEYDIQICLRYQEIQVWPKFRSEVYLFLLLYINRSITKKFPSKKLLEMMNSSVRNLGEVESIISRSVLIRNCFVMDQFSERFEVHIATVHELVHNKKFPN